MPLECDAISSIIMPSHSYFDSCDKNNTSWESGLRATLRLFFDAEPKFVKWQCGIILQICNKGERVADKILTKNPTGVLSQIYIETVAICSFACTPSYR